ncbi:MFS transporter [Streptomyces radicis]|uniref:MFS transporter n=1 Tax=Streptomyces radicis TaxID=1750517 RepID=A0A3A9W8U3_9ACTN|nr:MFS transporter [Streptomyces radicis]RKN09290.1 MFS transporter [Streptomyces radicis]RKN23112.1 MFS transporter [Streptomyces radicis]
MSTATGVAVRARVAVAAVFFTNGFVFANVVPRYPEIKDDLGLSHTALGTAIAAMPLGALVIGLLASPLIRRFGSAWTAVVALALLGANVVFIGTAPGFALLCVALFIAGSLDSITDVAMNAHGMRVQRLYGRSILNSFHGLWSVGAVLGGLTGAGAAQAGIPLPVHLAVAGAITVGAAAVAFRFLLPGPDDAEREAAADDAGKAARGGPGWPVIRLLAVLGLLSAAAAAVEDSGASWGSVYLRGELAANAVVGGLGFAALQGAQTVGRLLGDRVVHRLGDRNTSRLGGLLVVTGMGAALLWPSVPSTLAGFALAGLGIATLIPAAFHAADEIPGLWPGAGITVTAFLLRIGFLLSPPLVGVVADASSIRVGLVVVPLAGLVILLTSGILEGRRPAKG